MCGLKANGVWFYAQAAMQNSPHAPGMNDLCGTFRIQTAFKKQTKCICET